MKRDMFLGDSTMHIKGSPGLGNSMSGRRGTSLVEVLVVMVVLAVGIMTVIQMFPSGFRVIKAAESQTIATKLAQQEIERWKNMAANLPDGIMAVDENGNIQYQYPGPPFVDYQLNNPSDPNSGYQQVTVTASGAASYVRGNAFNTRQVVNESTLIPVGTYFNTAAAGQQVRLQIYPRVLPNRHRG